MFLEIPYEKTKEESIFIDVRTHQEFEDAHIPGAINIPLFNETERSEIGRIFKQVGVHEARRQGVQYASRNMLEIFDQVSQLRKNHYQDVVAYCARGGYRSSYFSASLSAIGIRVLKLDGGYKKYRHHVISKLEETNNQLNYLVIHGNTGTGKTKILQHLGSLGINILDLEKAAKHRGSVLGGVGLGTPISQKQFESNLLFQMDNLGKGMVCIEAESRRIGDVMIPKYIHDRMKNGIHIFVSEELAYRIELIKEEYTVSPNYKKESIESIYRLKDYLSNQKIKDMEAKIKNGEIDDVIRDLMTDYYDPMYQNKSKTYEYAFILDRVANPIRSAQMIKKWIEDHKHNARK